MVEGKGKGDQCCPMGRHEAWEGLYFYILLPIRSYIPPTMSLHCTKGFQRKAQIITSTIWRPKQLL